MIEKIGSFNLLAWIWNHKLKSLYLLLGMMTFGAFLGYAFPQAAVWIVQHNVIEMMMEIVQVFIMIGIAAAIVFFFLGHR